MRQLADPRSSAAPHPLGRKLLQQRNGVLVARLGNQQLDRQLVLVEVAQGSGHRVDGRQVGRHFFQRVPQPLTGRPPALLQRDQPRMAFAE